MSKTNRTSRKLTDSEHDMLRALRFMQSDKVVLTRGRNYDLNTGRSDAIYFFQKRAGTDVVEDIFWTTNPNGGELNLDAVIRANDSTHSPKQMKERVTRAVVRVFAGRGVFLDNNLKVVR